MLRTINSNIYFNTITTMAQTMPSLDTMKTVENDEVGNIKREISKSQVVVDELTVGQYQKTGTKTAMLRQKVIIKATYPSISIDNNMQQNVFDINEFDAAADGNVYETVENRVGFMDVPANTTVEAVQGKLAENASLYKVLSNKPILTNNHQNAITRGLTSMEEIAESQVVRYPEGDDKAGQLIPDANGNVQYRKIFFWNGPKTDEDNRNGDCYVSESLQTELTGEIEVTNQSQLV